MKKVLISVVVLVVVAFGGIKLVAVTAYGGTTYYTKITTSGERIIQRGTQGERNVDYRYRLTGYDAKGHPQVLDFNANKARPLITGAYLRLTYNDQKGVTRWTAIPKASVPSKALVRLK